MSSWQQTENRVHDS